MDDTQRTRNYLESLDAVYIKESIHMSGSSNASARVCIRKYYRKRNDKTCYVDTQIKYLDICVGGFKRDPDYRETLITEYKLLIS